MLIEEIKLGIVIPVLNEELTLPILFSQLCNSSHKKLICCIAVVDGLSNDNSKAIILKWKEKLPSIAYIENFKKITPVAFNLGIKTCFLKGANVILILSAHAWLSEDYFSNLYQIINEDNADIIGAVHGYPPPESMMESAIQAFSQSSLGRRLKYFSNLKTPTETSIAGIPTIHKRVFEKIGLFDVSMVRNQDNDFTYRAINAGFKVVTFPNLRYIYNPRSNLIKLCKQMYKNGFYVGVKPYVHSLKHWAPFLFYFGVLMIIISYFIFQLNFSYPLVFLITLYILAILIESASWFSEIKYGIFLLFFIFFSTHICYAAGTLMGLLSNFKKFFLIRSTDKK